MNIEKRGYKMEINKIIQSIKDYETIIIHRHVRPDPDAYGSQVGLKGIIKQSFPKKNVYAVGEEESSLSFLARMDQVSDEQYKEALVIVCDTANTDRICDQRYQLADKIIKIDHHPNHDPYGDILWVNTGASSTSEMIFELYTRGKEAGLQMSDDAAYLMYAGIVGDTGRFLFPSTSKRTLQIAAELVTYTFDRTALYNNLYNVDLHIAKLRGYVLQNFTLSKAGVSTVKLTTDILKAYNVEAKEAGQLVGTLGDIEGLHAWAFFIEEEPGLIRVRLRSKGPIINKVAAAYNGGGHPLASGATVHSWEEAALLIDDLEKVCQAY